jgi:farnesyl diphosphate synthase
LKTGALITWSVEAGAIWALPTMTRDPGLRGYAQKSASPSRSPTTCSIAPATTAKVGKRVRKDEGQGKENFVTFARRRARARQQGEVLV